jgi:hypothetical protein
VTCSDSCLGLVKNDSNEREEHDGEKCCKDNDREYCGSDWSEVVPRPLIPSNEPERQYASNQTGDDSGLPRIEVIQDF